MDAYLYLPSLIYKQTPTHSFSFLTLEISEFKFSVFLLFLSCSLTSSRIGPFLSVFPSQMVLLFPWLSSSLCQRCLHLYFWPKPLPICPLNNSTGTSHRHFKCKVFKSLLTVTPDSFTFKIYIKCVIY